MADTFWGHDDAWEIDPDNRDVAHRVQDPHTRRNLYHRIGPGVTMDVTHIHPGESQTLETLEASDLSPEQNARSAALYAARGVLERRGGIGNQVAPPARMDLLSVAQWILTGSYRVEEG